MRPGSQRALVSNAPWFQCARVSKCARVPMRPGTHAPWFQCHPLAGFPLPSIAQWELFPPGPALPGLDAPAAGELCVHRLFIVCIHAGERPPCPAALALRAAAAAAAAGSPPLSGRAGGSGFRGPRKAPIIPELLLPRRGTGRLTGYPSSLELPLGQTWSNCGRSFFFCPASPSERRLPRAPLPPKRRRGQWRRALGLGWPW